MSWLPLIEQEQKQLDHFRARAEIFDELFGTDNPFLTLAALSEEKIRALKEVQQLAAANQEMRDYLYADRI